MFFLVLWVLGLLTAGGQLFMGGITNLSLSEICNVLLLHQFVVTFGSVGIIGLIVNIIRADQTAEMLGWPGGLFQIKYGFSQIGLGIMGLMAIWFKGNFWVGTLVTMYIYGISGLWSHCVVYKEKKEETGKSDIDSIANIIMDVAYQMFITVLSILAGGIWVFN